LTVSLSSVLSFGSSQAKMVHVEQLVEIHGRDEIQWCTGELTIVKYGNTQKKDQNIISCQLNH
jgi:hypothetical protein